MGSFQPDSPVRYDRFSNIIDGGPSDADRHCYGVDPTNEEKLWPVPVASPEDVERAVQAAKRAFASWSTTTWEKRSQELVKYRQALEGQKEELTRLLTRETGKPAQFAALEIQTSLEYFDWHFSLKQPTLEKYEDTEKIIENMYTPIGVVAAICPWNFPILLSLAKIVPALLTGNTIIVKPSPFTPYTALKLVETANHIFPPGVVQALGGNDDLGPALVAHPGVGKISFTGSIATGKKIVRASADALKKVTLELGGNDPSIVLPDVDVAKVARQVAMGAFYNSGQVCIATKRIFIHESIYAEFVDALVQAARSFKVGSPYEDDVMLGPIQNETQYRRVQGFFEDSRTHNYTFAGGVDIIYPDKKGFYVQPTIIDNPPKDSRIYAEEPFGPIVPCQPYRDISDAIARANETQCGLGATVFGNNVREAREVAEQIESGMVWVNSYPTLDPRALFGGVKQSGLGTEFGTLGILAFLNTKAVHVYKT